MIIIFIIIIIVFLAVYLFIHQPQFGRMPSGERLEKIKHSPNYRNGQFQNISHTPMLAEGANYFNVLWNFFFNKEKRNIPSAALPSQKTDLLHLDPAKNIMVWFGHSSYFMQVDGKRILVDPVLSGNASPVSFTTRSFKGSDIYTAEEIPDIDYLFITHDHWDHLDHQTIVKLSPRISKVITGLGTGAHLEYWGIDHNSIIETDWYQETALDVGFIVNTLPARHFSGRGLKRNQSVWVSFLLTTPSRKIYIGGDSGYDAHFAETGNKFGPIDLAILEDGQYNSDWRYIHMLPEQTVQAAIDLKAKALFPVHWSKFSLALHAWDEPIIKAVREASYKHLPVLHPMIGQAVDLDHFVNYPEWWTTLTSS